MYNKCIATPKHAVTSYASFNLKARLRRFNWTLPRCQFGVQNVLETISRAWLWLFCFNNRQYNSGKTYSTSIDSKGKFIVCCTHCEWCVIVCNTFQLFVGYLNTQFGCFFPNYGCIWVYISLLILSLSHWLLPLYLCCNSKLRAHALHHQPMYAAL